MKLISLLSLVNGGLSKGTFERMCKEVVEVYGYQHIMTIQNLIKAGK